MSLCPGCGGVVGRDCFNPQECAWITQDMAQRAEQDAYYAAQEAECHAEQQRERDADVARCEAEGHAEHEGSGRCFCGTRSYSMRDDPVVRFLDGPAKGEVMVRRCPVFVRAVVGPRGKLDVLDQLEDEPRPDEQVYVYRIVEGTWACAFVRPGGRYEFGDYRFVLGGVEADALRDTVAWRAWVDDRARGEAIDG